MKVPFKSPVEYKRLWALGVKPLAKTLFLGDPNREEMGNGFYWGYILLPRREAEMLAGLWEWRIYPDTPEWHEGWRAGFKKRLEEL